MRKNPVVGIAGCGSMGLPMAQALQDTNYEVWGLDVRPANEFGTFQSRMLEDPAEFGRRVQVVISVVRDVAQTLDVCFDRQALFAQPQYPKTLIISSTLTPRFIPELRRRLPADVTLIDAPMSGAPHAARLRKLSFMLGGPNEALDHLMPLFDAMGQHVFRLGPLGAGMTAKVLNNYVASASVVAVRRAYARARELGADLETLRSVMQASSGATWFGDHFHEIDWSRQGYEPDNTIGILEKDIRSGLDAMAGAEHAAPDAFDAALLEAIRAMEPFEGT
jgi:3-hydroxyisobutyrate dehydrogenase-like beta-hydroxyacid dehydrogenase